MGGVVHNAAQQFQRKKPARETITKRAVDAMRPGDIIADDEVRGFVIRCLPSGTRTYGFRYVNAAGKQRWLPLGLHGSVTPDGARRAARKAAGQVADGRDPVAEKGAIRARAKADIAETLKAVGEDYLIKKCGMRRDGRGKPFYEGDLRTADQRRDIFERLVWPTLGMRSIGAIRRSEIARLLDTVEEQNGPRQADLVLAYLSALFNWYASRSDDFRSPLVRGMARTKPRERARTRVLDDQEIRDLWQAIDEGADQLPACYPRYVRTLLLTALRRREASNGSWTEITGEVWTIPGARMKGKLDHVVALPPAVLALIGVRPKNVKAAPYIFSTTGGARPFSGYSKGKAQLDRLITAIRKKDGRPAMAPWTHHDLRRTAKTLMARAGVRPDISERVLAHVITGVEGVYDRFEYVEEKRDALERLAALVERIVHPPAANVVDIREAV